MLDCHVIVSAETPRAWVTQCLDSVHLAANHAGYPVAVHTVEGVPGHIGRARSSGYALGAHPYVTSVDDDDWIEPSAFAVLADAMRKSPAAIFTRERLWQNGKAGRGRMPRHHLAVYRRDITSSFYFEPWRAIDNLPLARYAEASGEVIDVPDCIYNHRVYRDSKARQLRRLYPEEGERLHG